jgi:DNA-binding NarL/FixJ family response regulator
MDAFVLLIDDDRLAVPFYKEALESAGIRVEQCLHADSAIRCAQTEKDRISVIILDIMIPPGERYRNIDTADGLKTGVFLYTDLRQMCPGTPIVVLTNVTDSETLNELRKLGADVKRKADVLPSTLRQIVRTLITQSAKPK